MKKRVDLPCPCFFRVILEIFKVKVFVVIDFGLNELVDILDDVLPSSEVLFSLENFFEERQEGGELILRG